jgi:hypothetical protein
MMRTCLSWIQPHPHGVILRRLLNMVNSLLCFSTNYFENRLLPNDLIIVRNHLDDERLVPDIPRYRGRLVGGDLDIGEEDSEQTIITLQSLHHGSIGYQHTRTRVGLAKKAKFL